MTGEPKKHVEHLAVSLRFHCVGIDQWCMSIRPERRFTFDGFKSVDSKGVGKRATKKKSHMYNIDYLKEVHFWRDFLSDGLPRIVFKFGDKQGIVIDTEMLESTIQWPEVHESKKNIMHIQYQEDLFSIIELHDVEEDGEWWLDSFDEEGIDEN